MDSVQAIEIPKLPTVVLNRDTQSPERGTLGILSVSGVRICDTLELPDKNNAEYISRITAGLYRLAWQWSHHFNAMRWHITGVPGRSAVELHKGNTLKDTEGCVLLGLERVVSPEQYYILQSIPAFERFYNAMKQYRTTGSSILITDPSQRG